MTKNGIRMVLQYGKYIIVTNKRAPIVSQKFTTSKVEKHEMAPKFIADEVLQVLYF